jgi:DNA (cytosine-5)-methyltransferase 3A
MNVLSLFDGMSCGQQALERQGIKVDNYYASEIDKYAISITQKNYPNTIQLGSVVSVDVTKLQRIDLLIGGSPCQSFSFAGKRKGMSTKDEIEILSLDQYLELKEQNFDFEGQSYLFWEYMRLLTDIRKTNPDVKFLLENVMMGEKWEKVLSRAIGVNPIEINSALVSAQNRRRLYWTNIGMKPSGLFGDLESIIVQPKDQGILLKDILESEVDEKYFLSDKAIKLLGEKMIDKSIANEKSKTIDGSYYKGVGIRCDDCRQVVVHNLMPRSSTTGKGGTGHLSRNDGKTYCLDTGNTNAVEVREVRQLNRNNESNNNTQPFQQNRVYDINGISPALQAQLTTGSTMINTSRIRRLTPTECERLQTVNDGYTEGVSDTQRYRMLGNGWTVEVIKHIFSYLNNN